MADAVSATLAPSGLREHLEAERGRLAAATARRRRVRVLVPAAALVVAAVAAVVLAAGGGSSPSVLAAAQLAARGPTLPAPEPGSPTVLRAEVDGVAFPAWDRAFGWKASGARADSIDGRATKTVFYSYDGVEAAYTIVAGAALEIPDRSRTHEVSGTRLWVLDQDGRRVVSWDRGGHTCVMSASRAVSERRLLELAAWKTADDAS